MASASVLGGTAAPALAAGCPNEAIRAEQGEAGLALPDCRAFEMVSPPASSPVKEKSGNVASLSGNRVSYRSWNPYTGQEHESLRYIAERGTDGWTIYNPTPGQNGAKGSKIFACDASFAVTPELDHLLLVDGFHTVGNGGNELETEGEECLGDEPPLDPGEARGYANIFRTDPAATSFQLMNRPPAGVEGRNGELAAYTPDASVALFAERTQLTPDAPAPGVGGEDLYLSQNGTIRYAAYLPDGTPVLAFLANGPTGGFGTSNIANITHAISDDGERLVFEYESKIYLREHALRAQSATNGEECTEPAKACTIPIDTLEEGPSEFQEPGFRRRWNRHFLYATPDDSRIFFMDDRKVTPDSTTELPSKNAFFELVNGKSDLYEYDVATGETTDLTVNAGEAANVRGFSGAAEDASYIYFVAFGVLTGSQENSNGDAAVAGGNNLYVLHNGVTTFVATMTGGETQPSGAEAGDWGEGSESGTATESGRNQNTGNLTTRISRNGKFFAFPSAAELTGFDNTPAEPGDCLNSEFGAVPGTGCTELYYYDAEAKQLACASCSPSGEAPTGRIILERPSEALEPGNGSSPAYLPHAVSESGALFFDTPNSLLPADENGDLDVYEYENGALHLISTGVGIGPTRFVDAGVDGNNVFFSGAQALVGRDTDNSNSLYDARVDGGFVEPPALPGCEGEACRGASTAKAGEIAAGTPSFTGPGNKVEKPKHDCTPVAAEAKKLSKKAKQLNRQAAKASGPKAAKLKGKAAKYAKQGSKASKRAKTCRRSNQGGGK